MEVKIELSKSFKKEFKRLCKRYSSMVSDYERLLNDLNANPQLGTDIGGGVRKIRLRIASKCKGKSGGARVITFNVIVSSTATEINLIYIYDKADRENISPKEIEELLCGNGFI